MCIRDRLYSVWLGVGNVWFSLFYAVEADIRDGYRARHLCRTELRLHRDTNLSLIHI